MGKILCLSLLLTVSLFSGGCQSEEPIPDFSGLQNVTYTLHAITGSSATNDVIVRVYPNPFVNSVNVKVFVSSGEMATIYFSDEKGKYTKKIELPDGNKARVEVEFGRLPKGIYLCEVKANGKISRYRLVKAK